MFAAWSCLMADEFDVIENAPTKPVIFPVTNKELREFIPLIPRMLTKEELFQKAQKEAAEKARKEREQREREQKIKNNFAQKEKLKEVKKAQVNVKADGTDADFFNTLEENDSQPINME